MQIEQEQQAVCARFGTPYFGCDLSLKVGISRNVKEGMLPLNGMRIMPVLDTCGWYIWAGKEYSNSADFFVPLHGAHLSEWAPLIVPYLALPPGWRFLITDDYEDVWKDPEIVLR